jgi:hypothetical protein
MEYFIAESVARLSLCYVARDGACAGITRPFSPITHDSGSFWRSQDVKINLRYGGVLVMLEQPMRKLLGALYPTISWLNEKGSVEVSAVPDSHIDAIKQLERIGVVHKRNNRLYELQKIRLKKLLGNMGIEALVAEQSAEPALAPDLN